MILSAIGPAKESRIQAAHDTLWRQAKGHFADQDAFTDSFRRALTEGTERGLWLLDPPVVADAANWPSLQRDGVIKVRQQIVLPPPPPRPPGLGSYRIRAGVPWDKLSDFLRGVVLPLHADGADLDVEVSLRATSSDRSIKKSTLDQKVGETLQQIGAEVREEGKE